MNIDYRILRPVWHGTLSLKDSDDLQSKIVENVYSQTENTVLLLNHPPTFAIGARKSWKNLLVDKNDLEKQGFCFFQSSRGGDITYHWPGQLNVYPVININRLKIGPSKYMNMLEETAIRILSGLGISGQRQNGYTGIWHKNEKVVSMGTRIFRGITSYGFAINIKGDIDPVNHIIPCGYKGMGFTTIERITGLEYDIRDIVPDSVNELSEVFNMDLIPLGSNILHSNNKMQKLSYN